MVDASLSTGKILWTHPNPTSTSLHTFLSLISEKYNVPLATYADLHAWSISHLSDFWREVWDFTRIQCSIPPVEIIDPNAPMFPPPQWFSGAKLNFAENLLFPANVTDPKVPAVIAATEETRETLSWRDLRELVRALVAAMHGKIQPGDRVVGYVGNHVEALVAMLATTALGGVWSGVSPDHGVTAVLERWSQLGPTILFADSAVFYNGRAHDALGKVPEIVKGLGTLKHVVVIPKFEEKKDVERDLVVPFTVRKWSHENFLLSAKIPARPLEFVQLPPEWPVYILFSSGTTGAPKCIVHGAAGTLIQHKKEHQLQCNMKPGDVFFQFTTVTWMMWHWLVSGLASGVTIVLYDGSPFKPTGDLSMPSLLHELSITHFGTSAKYLSILEQRRVMPRVSFPLKHLKAIYSTAAVLAPSTFEYVHEAFGDVQLASITGGTDIISLFGAPSPLLPVRSGEIQCIGLGMAVESWDPLTAQPAGSEPGDLVAVRPFPCQPVSFFGPTGTEAYKKSYFETFPNVWHHGDFIRILPSGGLLMLGRSDGILKPAGVRFGSAEIYNLLLSKFPDEIEDAVCVGRRRPQDTDEMVVLFVKPLAKGGVDENLKKRIAEVVRRELSGRHVPGIIDECEDIPVTTNGKKVEVAVKRIVCGMEGGVGASVANAECLEWYREWARRH
jgi:acetoacetyl-CoA synthetase